DVARVVQHPLELLERDVEQVAHRRGQRLEEPDVGHRHRQLDVTHPLATNLREGDLDAAPVADHAAIANPLVLAARALPVLDRTEDPLAEQAVLLGLERAIVDRLGLGDLTPRPPVALSLHLEPLALLGIARPPDLLCRGDPDADVVEVRAPGLATAAEIDHRITPPLRRLRRG